jgi:hypothetical protein
VHLLVLLSRLVSLGGRLEIILQILGCMLMSHLYHHELYAVNLGFVVLSESLDDFAGLEIPYYNDAIL